MDTLWAAQRATIVVAALLLGGCDLGNDDEKGDAGGEGEGGENADSGESGGMVGECADEADEDADGICDSLDLCNDAAGTHCFEMGVEMAAVMSENTIADGGRFAAFVGADIRFGATLEVEGVADVGPCQGEAGVEARGYSAQVVEVNAHSTNPDVQAYLDAELLAEFQAEGVLPALRFIAMGPEDAPQLQIAFMAGLPPGHVFLLADGYTYTPECGALDMGTVIEGSGGMFRIDHATPEGVSDRIQGARTDYRVYPVGG
jgi:hypothetical protein